MDNFFKDFDKWNELKKKLHTSEKTKDFYYRITQGDEDDSVVILSQIRLISSKRLLRKMRMMKESEFEDIKNKVKRFLP